MIQIFDNETKELIFTNTNILNIDIKDSKTITKYQVEDGTTKNDHIYENALEIEIALLLAKSSQDENLEQFTKILSYYKNNKAVIIQSNMNVYENMIIEEIPHCENKDIFDGATINMKLSQWRNVKPIYGELKDVKSSKHSDTQNIGRQQGSEIDGEEKKKNQSILKSWVG